MLLTAMAYFYAPSSPLAAHKLLIIYYEQYSSIDSSII